MPRYKFECTAMVRRIYEVEAASEEAAEDIINETGSDHMVGEEDISEDIDDVSEILQPEPTK